MARSLDAHIDALESSMGVKFKDRSGVATAMRGMVHGCMEDDDDGEDEDENQGKGKGLSIGSILAKAK